MSARQQLDAFGKYAEKRSHPNSRTETYVSAAVLLENCLHLVERPFSLGVDRLICASMKGVDMLPTALRRN